MGEVVRRVLSPLDVGLVLALAVAGCGRLAGTSGSPTTTAPGTAFVSRVVDGDTVVVMVQGKKESVRLIGIDTPESVKPGTPVQCFALEASARTKALLPAGTRVRLVNDVEARDRYDRLLAYVYADDLKTDNGRVWEMREALAVTASHRGGSCYVVEVCTRCSWNHLHRSFRARSAG